MVPSGPRSSMGLLRLASRLLAVVLFFCGTACSSVLGEHEPALEETEAPAPAESLAFLPDLLQARDRTLLPEPDFQKAMDALGAGEPRQAAILLNGLRNEAPYHLELARLHAWALLQSGDPEAAERELTAFSSEHGGDDAGLAFVMAQALWELDRQAESAPWFRKVLETRPNDLGLLEKAAKASYAAGDGAYAVRAIDRILVRKPLSAELALMRARALAVDGKWEPAMALYDRLLVDKGDDPAFWDEAGLVAFQSALAGKKPVRFLAAAGYFQRATKIAPQDARVQYNLACCLDWGGNHPAAIEAYERAIELQPDYWNAVENLVELLARDGKTDHARAVLKEVLRQPLSPAEVLRAQAVEEGLDQGRISEKDAEPDRSGLGPDAAKATGARSGAPRPQESAASLPDSNP